MFLTLVTYFESYLHNEQIYWKFLGYICNGANLHADMLQTCNHANSKMQLVQINANLLN